ncbi:MFS transporter [Kitasatospora kifunensis]|uniref:Putative MFS family arabinose efflux permease n=1 Tax=Kitasatospora kifunensis TaxID=58351 RepID=A0A7W7VWX9_KITKI|nr:MFS transporter [Kitasatospora kifunensis]MBB4925977.1 putative MFS family arabinose efflux permease [Kitasatospora kifunensis]
MTRQAAAVGRPSAAAARDAVPVDPRWRRQVYAVFAATGVAYLAVALTIPVLPQYVTGVLHGSADQVGWVMGSYTATAVLSRPFAGTLLSRVGPRPVLAGGMAVMAASTMAYSLAHSVPLLLVCRLLLGLGLGATLSAATVWMVTLAPPERQTWALGLVGLVNYLVLAAGAPFGGPLQQHFGDVTTWLIAGLTPLLALPLLLGAPSSKSGGSRRTGGGRDGSAFKATLLPGTAMALAAFGYAAVISFATSTLEQRGVGGAATVVTAYAVAMVAIRLLSSRLSWDFTSATGLAAVLLAELLGTLLIGAAHALPVALCGAALVAIGMAQSYPALGTLVVRATEDHQRGPALATYGASINIGIGVGNVVLGKAAHLAGNGAAFAAAAIAIAGGAALATVAARRHPLTTTPGG